MKMRDGSILIHGDQPYDPKKAHDYYLRTRKLKGRKKGVSEIKTVGPKTKVITKKRTAKQQVAWNKFLTGLPMTQEGATVQETEKFVNSLRGKPDSYLLAEAKRIEKKFGKRDGARVATIQKLIKNRNRIRAAAQKPKDPASAH